MRGSKQRMQEEDRLASEETRATAAEVAKRRNLKQASQGRVQRKEGFYLPQDLMVEILYSLPVKSLVRFLCVCKPWHSLIKTPTFISEHLTRITYNKNDICWGHNSEKFLLQVGSQCRIYGYSSSLSHSDNNREFYYKDCGLGSGILFHVVGVCNGLACLKKYKINNDPNNDELIIWNPAIQKSLRLPKPMGVQFSEKAFITEGFGFDSRTNDYKLLRIAQKELHFDFNNYYSGGRRETELGLYSFKTGAWKDITFASGAPHSHWYHTDLDHVSANGFIYFVGNIEKRDRTIYSGIIQFDVSNEVFREHKIPEEVDCPVGILSITAYGDSSIALFEPLKGNLYLSDWQVWVLRNHGGEAETWFKLYISREDQVAWPLTFTRNGMLIMKNYEGYVVLFDLRSKQSHKICEANDDYLFASRYVESLELLDGHWK